MRDEEFESYRRLLEILEQRAALLELLRGSLDPRRPFVRVGAELEHPELSNVALVGAAYGLAHRTLGTVSLLGPVRMDYDKAIRSVHSAAAELSRFVEDVYEDRLEPDGDDRARLLRAARSRARRERAGHQARVPASWRASCIRTSRRSPTRSERFREVAEAYQVLSNSETREVYDRYGHAGLRGGGFTPGAFDFGSLSDIFSAFFGDDLFGGAGTRRARGADIAAEVEIELVEAASGVTRDVPFGVSVACERCSGNGAEPGTSPITCPTCNGAGRVQQVSRSVFGEFVRAQACPQCGGAGRIVTTPCTDCEGSGRTVEERQLDGRRFPPGSTTASRSGSAARATPASSAAARATSTFASACEPDPRFVREGDDIFSTVDLNIVEAALGTTVTIETLEGAHELEFEPGTQPGEIRVLRGPRDAGAAGLRPRRPPRARQRRACRARLTDEQRGLLEEFERLSTDETYKQDEGFFDKLKSAFR